MVYRAGNIKAIGQYMHIFLFFSFSYNNTVFEPLAGCWMQEVQLFLPRDI